MKTYRIPPGTYVLENEKAHTFWHDVMFGKYSDNPHLQIFTHKQQYEIGWDFSGAEDVVIEAYGVTLLSDGIMTSIALQHCKNVTVKGLTVDMKRRSWSKGKIVAAENGSFTVRFESAEWLTENMPIPRMIITDRRTGHIRHCFGAAFNSKVPKRMLDDCTIQIDMAMSDEYVGDDIYICHTLHTCPAILIYEAENVRLEDVTVLNHAGMGIVGHRSNDIFLHRVNVVPPVGNAVSTNTDATHFPSCKGILQFTDCRFEGHGDDAANVHGYYQTVTEILEKPNTYRLKVMVYTEIHSLRLDHPDIGDILEFCYKKDLCPLEKYRVLDMIPEPDTWTCVVTLDRSLPSECVGNYLTDITQLPSLEFIRCTVFNHLARGILIRTRNAVVKDCRFACCTLDAIQISAESYWNESAVSENITIENNVMLSCGLSVYIGADVNTKPLHKNFHIIGNTITAPVHIACVDGLVWENNNVSKSVDIENCSNVSSTESFVSPNEINIIGKEQHREKNL